MDASGKDGNASMSEQVNRHNPWWKMIMIMLFKQFRYRYLVARRTVLKEWTTPDFRNTPSATNLEEKEIVDVPGNDGKASIPERVKRPNPWRKMIMMVRFKQFWYRYLVSRRSVYVFSEIAKCERTRKNVISLLHRAIKKRNILTFDVHVTVHR